MLWSRLLRLEQHLGLQSEIAQLLERPMENKNMKNKGAFLTHTYNNMKSGLAMSAKSGQIMRSSVLSFIWHHTAFVMVGQDCSKPSGIRRPPPVCTSFFFTAFILQGHTFLKVPLVGRATKQRGTTSLDRMTGS